MGSFSDKWYPFQTRTIARFSGSAGFFLLCIILCAPLYSSCAALIAAARSGGGVSSKPQVLNVRVFGGNSEAAPPIITRAPQNVFGTPQDQNGQNAAANDASGVIGSSFVTVEVDVQCAVQPAFIATLTHCDAFWVEDKNFVINDPSLRITQIQVFQANTFSRYFTHRARFTVPSSEVQLRFSGNWKAKIFDAEDMATPIGEARFFVVDQETATSLVLLPDGYSPRIGGTSPAANLVEAAISAPPQFFDENFHTVTLYRAWRWNEPFVITQKPDQSRVEQMYGRSSKITVLGFSGGQKRFRITAVPAENEYRVLDIRDALRFPASTAPLRFALADLRRNGVMFMRADDGAFSSAGVQASRDEYVLMEFVLASEGAPSSREIFVMGSFNNWQALPDWKMRYDSTLHQYTLAQWIRRGRHNYLYASGTLSKQTGTVEAYDFEECEGNSLSANHTFYALFYYRNPQFGGYDALLGAAAANTSRRGR
ncbi:MAG: DUF5103 domain-containing protein [Candidatus Kapabacteria bacterium]|jgi:hypothetical protein|nr:DUF5103 domain-containing protein [Candidatus Kapabacteria bacterium]